MRSRQWLGTSGISLIVFNVERSLILYVHTIYIFTCATVSEHLSLGPFIVSRTCLCVDGWRRPWRQLEWKKKRNKNGKKERERERERKKKTVNNYYVFCFHFFGLDSLINGMNRRWWLRPSFMTIARNHHSGIPSSPFRFAKYGTRAMSWRTKWLFCFLWIPVPSQRIKRNGTREWVRQRIV